MSKQDPAPRAPSPDLPPPSYNEATTHASGSSSSHPPSYDPTHYTSHLSQHLSSLPSRIRASQAQHITQQAAQDLDLITLLAPELETFLSDLAALPRSPPRAEMTLVPAAVVGPKWSLSHAQERRREGEVVQLVRVAAPAALCAEKCGKGSGEKGGKAPEAEPRREFDEWGRWDDDSGASSAEAPGSWWWRDEPMARRLAAYLQPKPEPPVERKVVREAVQQAKQEKRSWGWGRSKKSEGASSSATAPVVVRETDTGNRIVMAVRAEEVTFRRENDFGVFESMTGCGIVARVRITRTQT